MATTAPATPVAAGPAAGPLPRALWAGPLLALAGAVLFSGKAIIVKLAYRHGVDAITLLTLRMAVALPFFVLMAAWAGRGQPALSGRQLLAVGGLGFSGYYLSSYLDFLGLQHISAGLERLILYTAPALVLLINRVLFRQPTRPRQWALLALGYAGLLLVFGQELRLQGPQVALGAALVLASTACYAAYLVGSGAVVRRIGSVRLAGWATGVASLLCLLHFTLAQPQALAALARVPAPVWWLSLLNGTLCTVLPVWLVMAAIERIGSSRSAQLGMVGPVSTLLLGVLLLGESLTLATMAGSACVLASVAMLARLGPPR